ncbi:MAG TPA: hypothetical protein VFX24_11440, partial [Ktedonobacterales bacterium]|nr:hypothetical protein [Ktedonobacterales bacterium]
MPTASGALQSSTLWQRYRGLSRNIQVLIAVGAALTLLVCSCGSCSVFASALNSEQPTAVSTATTHGVGQVAHKSNSPATATATRPLPTATATPRPKLPTATPKPLPTSTPKPKPPTATPKPSCIPGAVKCNPWGYNYSGGNLIYDPDPGICPSPYFSCIKSFWKGNGYVVECHDGDLSKSGGIRGSCSHHRGEWRPLYAP